MPVLKNDTDFELPSMREKFSPDVQLSGTYGNARFMHTACSLVGCTVRIKLKDGRQIEGILKTFSANFDVGLALACEVPGDDIDLEQLCFGEENVSEKLIIRREDIVMLSTITDLDAVTKGVFVTDAEISRYNGEVQEKVLEAWEPDFDHEHGDHLGEDEEDLKSGWTPEEMFKKNEKMGVETSYKEDMSQYTTVGVDEESPDFEHKRAQAERIAREIESNPASKRAMFLENDDEERDLASTVSDGFSTFSNSGGKMSGGKKKGDRAYRPGNKTAMSSSQQGIPKDNLKSYHQRGFPRPSFSNDSNSSSNAHPHVQNENSASGGGVFHSRSAASIRNEKGPNAPLSKDQDSDWPKKSRKNERNFSSGAEKPDLTRPPPMHAGSTTDQTATRKSSNANKGHKEQVAELKEFQNKFRMSDGPGGSMGNGPASSSRTSAHSGLPYSHSQSNSNANNSRQMYPAPLPKSKTQQQNQHQSQQQQSSNQQQNLPVLRTGSYDGSSVTHEIPGGNGPPQSVEFVSSNAQGQRQQQQNSTYATHGQGQVVSGNKMHAVQSSPLLPLPNVHQCPPPVPPPPMPPHPPQYMASGHPMPMNSIPAHAISAQNSAAVNNVELVAPVASSQAVQFMDEQQTVHEPRQSPDNAYGYKGETDMSSARKSKLNPDAKEFTPACQVSNVVANNVQPMSPPCPPPAAVPTPLIGTSSAQMFAAANPAMFVNCMPPGGQIQFYTPSVPPVVIGNPSIITQGGYPVPPIALAIQPHAAAAQVNSANAAVSGVMHQQNQFTTSMPPSANQAYSGGGGGVNTSNGSTKFRKTVALSGPNVVAATGPPLMAQYSGQQPFVIQYGPVQAGAQSHLQPNQYLVPSRSVAPPTVTQFLGPSPSGNENLQQQFAPMQHSLINNSQGGVSVVGHPMLGQTFLQTSSNLRVTQTPPAAAQQQANSSSTSYITVPTPTSPQYPFPGVAPGTGPTVMMLQQGSTLVPQYFPNVSAPSLYQQLSQSAAMSTASMMQGPGQPDYAVPQSQNRSGYLVRPPGSFMTNQGHGSPSQSDVAASAPSGRQSRM